MKRFLLSMLAATMFVACALDNTEDGGIQPWNDNVPIRISMEQTRANDSAFENGDKVGLYVVNYEGATAGSLISYGNHVDNMCFTLTNDWTPDETIYWKDQTTLTDFYAYYPYSSSVDVKAHSFSVLTNQNSEANYFASDFLWGKKSKVTPTQEAVSIATKHLFSNALIYVVAGEGVTAEELKSANIEVKVCNVETAAMIDLTTGTVLSNGSIADITPWNTGEYYRAMIVPQRVTATDNLVEILVNNEKYTYATNMTFESGTRHKITITITRDGDSPSNGGKLKVTFTIEQWNDDEFDYGGNASKEPGDELPPATDFAVAWSNQTPIGATATISVLDPNKRNMVFGAFTFGESELVQNDGPMPLSTRAGAAKKTPAEYAAEQLALMADPMMGFGGLYFCFYQMAQQGTGYLLSEIGNVMNCSLYSWRGVEKKMYVAVVGINKNADLDNYVDNSTRATSINIFVVENLPQPEVVVVTENNVAYTAGSLSLDVTVNNPYGNNGVISAESLSRADWLTATYENGKINITCKENPYAKARSAEVQVTYTYNCMVTQYGETMEMPVTATATVKVEQAANPNAKPVTFAITVKETHFDRIVVDVKPSDSEAYYVLGSETKADVNYYVQSGYTWSQICEYTLGGEAHQGTLTNYELKINTTYATDEQDQWIYYVYAFQTNAESSAVAGEASYVETPVTNDTPKVELSHSELVYNGSSYTLTVVGKGGDYAIDFDFINAVADGKLAFNTYPAATEKTYTSNGVLGNGGLATIDNEAKKLYFTVNDYPADWSKSYDPYVNLSFTYKQYVDGAFTDTSYGRSFNLKIVLKPTR